LGQAKLQTIFPSEALTCHAVMQKISKDSAAAIQGGGKIDSVLRNATLLLVAVGVDDDLCCGATATGTLSAPLDRFGQLLFAESGVC
tara:strand:- start:425 stop:685 length:261 start_codon:yes stop_codon:yes gene_type:complete